jgi:hypothetical protein
MAETECLGAQHGGQRRGGSSVLSELRIRKAIL